MPRSPGRSNTSGDDNLHLNQRVPYYRSQPGPGEFREGLCPVPVLYAEIHWYEAHGIGRKRFKIKRFLD